MKEEFAVVRATLAILQHHTVLKSRAGLDGTVTHVRTRQMLVMMTDAMHML